MTKSLDGSDGLIVTPDHSITVFKSGHQQNKPKLQGGVEEPVQITATSAVQPTNQDGEIEVSYICIYYSMIAIKYYDGGACCLAVPPSYTKLVNLDP